MAFRPALGTSTSSPLGASLRFFCDSAASAVPQVWTDAASTDGSWSAVPFARVPGSKTLWQAAFAVSRPGNFAFTYRLEHEHGRIEWLGGQGNDGAIEVLDAATAGTDTIESVFPDLRSLSLVSESSSGSASAKLFSFTLPGSQTSPVASFSLPSPTGTAYGFALERNKPTWYFPKHLSSLADLSSKLDNQLLVLSRPSHEQIVLAYPVSTPEVVTVLRGDGKGGVALRAEREALKQGKDGKAYVVLGKAPASALADLLAAAVTLGRSASTKSHRAPAPALADLQALRYCTWNSLGPQYSVKKVIKALKSFEEEGKFARAIDTVLLDDGWQDVGERPEVGGTGLRGFGAKKGWLDVDDLHDEEDEGAADASFSSSSTGAMHDSGYSSMATSPKMVHQEAGVSDRGLADLKKGVDAIKASGRGNIKRVGVWLTLAGYWDALDPSGDLAKRYNAQRWAVHDAFDTSDEPKKSNVWHLPSIEKVTEFWDDYFAGLKSAGVDFVKVDNQASVDYIFRCESDPKQDAGQIRSALHEAMHLATSKHFGPETSASSGVINCMSHTPRTWGASPLLPAPALMRTSDDFFPDRPDSHRWHLFVNVWNNLLARPLGLEPDLDMLMTFHPFARYHAALRTFSPSPIYVTDKPGEHNEDLVTKGLIAPLKKGGDAVVKTRKEIGAVLASTAVARDDVMKDEWGVAKVGLAVGSADGAVIGLWNVKKGLETATDVITRRDIIDALDPAPKQGAVYALFLSNAATFIALDPFDGKIDDSVAVASVDLPATGHEIATISSFHPLPGVPNATIAAVGLVDAICGLSAITKVGVETKPLGRPTVDVSTLSSSAGLSVPLLSSITKPRQPSFARSDASATTATSVSSGLSFSSRYGATDPFQIGRNIWRGVPPTQPGRIRYLISYVAGDRQPNSDSSIALASLRRDLGRRPVRTVLNEAKAFMRLFATLMIVAASTFWSRVWQAGRIEAGRVAQQDDEKKSLLSGPSPMASPSYATSPTISEVDLDEKQPFVESSFVPPASPIVRTPDIDINAGEEVFRIETPFTGKIRFVINFSDWPQPPLTTEGADAVGAKILVAVDGKAVESALEYRACGDKAGRAWTVDVDLAAVAQTQVDAVGGDTWVVEVRARK